MTETLMLHSLVAPHKEGPADILLFWFFENLTPEWQIETLSASRGSTTSDNLHLILVLTYT